MYEISDYLETAKSNEDIFRNVLRDLRDNAAAISYTEIIFIPFHIESSCKSDVDLPIEEIVKKYSKKGSQNYESFTIADFTITEKTKAVIKFNGHSINEDIALALEYLVKKDGSVEFKCKGFKGVFSHPWYLSPGL